ncbi:tyrosine-type recombinase/integrase [Desulfuromonas thiophila]|uniref:tyrosine-type recombinase/integrase n=1 Tax=Desulfuromonas thiophila TaxID=57664 RepID=UPI0038994F0D
MTVSFWFCLVIVNLLGHGDITPNQCPRKPAPLHKQDELNLARDLQKAIGSRSVEEVTRNDLQKIISGIVDRGAYVQAQRTRSTIRKMFRWAEQEQIIKENPALTLSPLKNRQSKTRVLSLEEILVLWANIDSEKRLPKVIGIILKIILLTGVRPGEAIKIYKKYAGASWVLLDSRETKNKNPHRVYLSSLAKGLFESIDDDSTLSSDPKYKIENYTLSSWIRRLNYLGLEKWSPHDLRRSCATMLAQQGTELHIIKKVLNHSDSDITSSVYVIYMYDEQIKSALDILSEKIKENLHA